MEACKDFLGLDGDWFPNVKAEGSLIARRPRRARMKIYISDLTVPSGRTVVQWIQIIIWITG